jgi:uncharacterized protein YebE (UPF0316 family)
VEISDMDILLGALLIFALRVVGISVSTLATILMVQGRRFPAIASGSLSAFVYVIAIGRVVTNMDNVWNLAAYVLGFGVGTWVGMVLEQRMALGYADVRIISTQQGERVAAALRGAGFGVTQLHGYGLRSPVAILEALVPRKRVSQVLQITESIDDKATVAVYEARSVQRGYWGTPDRRR